MKIADLPPEFQNVHTLLGAFKDQLLLVLANRLGGRVELPVSEVDATGQLIGGITMVDTPAGPAFRIEVGKKS